MEAAPHDYLEEERCILFASMCVAWFTLGGCVLLCRVTRQAKQDSARFSVAPCVGRLCGLCRALLAGTAGGPSAKQVARELQKRRLVRANASIPYGCAAIACSLGLGLYRAVYNVERPNSFVQDILFLVGCFVHLWVWACPRTLTLRTLNAWSFCLVTLVVVWVSPVASKHVLVASSCLVPFGFTLVVCLFNTNFRLNFAWLCAVSSSICTTIYFGAEDPLLTEDCLPPRAQRISQVLLATCVFAVVVSFFHESAFLIVQYDMEANTSRSELKAARSVLRGVCDAVVELDSDFRLQDGSSELVDMLLLNPMRPLLGEDLRHFMASQQDREKFSEQMGRAWLLSEDAVGLSAAFHVSMKDSSSIPLDVEIFCVRFVNREGKAAYFVGIREFTDTSPMLRDSVSGSTQHGGRTGGPQGPWVGGPAPAAASADLFAAASSQDSSETCSEASSLCEHWEDLGAEAELVAWVDVLTPGYSVRLETPGFTQHVDAGGALLAALRLSHQDQDEFICWMQEAYFALTQEGSDPAQLEYHKRLDFRSPAPQRGAHSSGPSRQMLSALLTLDRALPPDGQDRGPGVVRAVLHDCRLGRRVPPQPQRPSLCGTPPATAEAASGQLRLAQEQASQAAPAAAPAAARDLGAARPDAAGAHAQLEDPAAGPPQAVRLGRDSL